MLLYEEGEIKHTNDVWPYSKHLQLGGLCKPLLLARADLWGVLGVLKHPPSRFIAPLSKFAGTGKSCSSSVSLDNLLETATVEEGRMEA